MLARFMMVTLARRANPTAPLRPGRLKLRWRRDASSEKMWDTPMELLPKSITRPVARLGAAAQNALEVARFGGLETDQEASPYEVASEQRVYRLRRYYPDRAD